MIFYNKSLRFLFCIFVCLVCVLSQFATAKILGRDIRIGIHKDKTRVVLELSEDVRYQVFALPDPYRIVIDLPDIKWLVPPATARRKGGIIAGLRYGQFQPGNGRVVLDLKSPGVVKKSFSIPPREHNGARIVVDIKNTSHSKFIKNLRSVPKRTRLFVRQLRSRKDKRLPNDKPLVVIDPGHGGIDPGAISLNGILEKRITLGMAYRIGKAISAIGRQRVIFTRNQDTFVRLRQRVAFARKAGADLFLSIHADSIANRRIRGGGVYTLSEKASDRESAALAEKENRADSIAGLNLEAHDDEVASILIELTQRETMNYSALFATSLVSELRQLVSMRRKPHRFAGFVVLKAPDVPSVLIELGYLSNLQDERMLTNPKKLSAIAKAIARAVDNYFSIQPK